MQLIVAATDGSEGGDRAVRMAAALAASCGVRLLIVTVEERHLEDREGMQRFASIEGGIGEAVEFIANRILHHAKEIAERQGLATIETQHVWGEPAKAIMNATTCAGADVLVVGRRGRGRVAGLVLGSVSQELVSRSQCAIIVVP